MKYKNNIGEYQSLDAVWSAYPSGGAEGDYCVIDGVIYAWNDVEKNWFAPDLTPSARKTQVVYGDMDVHNNLTVGGVLSARVVRGRNAFCGLFTDEASLNRHVPKPYVGQWALCLIEESNDNAIGEVYMCTADGTWTDAGFRGGFDGIMEVLFGESDARKANDNALLEMIEQVIVSLSEDYYNKREVDHLLEQFGIDVLWVYVDALPSTPSKKTMGKLYFVPAGDSQNPDLKDEYITVFEDDEYRWRKVGSTDIDLSDYYTKEEVYNKSETYSKNETNQTVNAAKEELYGAIAQAVDDRKKTRYIPFDLRGESIIFLSNEDMVELFGEQSLFDLTVNQYQHVYRVTNSKSEVFEIPAAYNNANGVRKIVGINGNLTLELTFTMGNDTYMNAALQYRETSIPAISYDEAQDLRPSQQQQARENIGVEVDGKIPTSLLPASVMDEVNNGWLNPTDGKFYKHRTGVEGSYVYTDEIAAADNKIYVDKAANKNYRWGGQSYIPIGNDLTLGETSETAFAGDRGKELEQTAIKSTEQSLSAQQKAQARTNIAAVSYDQQSLNADQQVQAQNNMMAKAYAPAEFSGLGKKVLSRNIEKVNNVDHNYMTQAFFKNGDDLITNTIFVIQYDYELKENVEIGAGCILDFDGGSISGAYTITGNDTQIKAPFVKIFGTDVTLAGTWNTEGHIRWFGADPAKADNAVYIQKALDSFLVVKIDAFYYKTSPLVMTKAHSLMGDSVRIEGTWIGFLLDENETGLTFQPTGGSGTQFKYIKGITFMDYNAPGTSPYYQTGTIGVDNTSARLDVEYCTFRNFDTGIKGGKNTWNNKFINCRYEKMNIAIDGITSNYVIIDKCEVRNINTFLILDGQDYPQDRPLAVNTAGIVVVSNSIFENTGSYLFIARKQEYTTLIFENNYVEIYSGDVFHGNFKHIRDINNFYYFGGTVKQLAYLWKPISIVAEGNKIYLNQSGNSFNRIYTCHPEYAESGDTDMLNTISSIANRIVRENHTGAIIDFELGATVNQYTIMIGFSYGSNGEMNPISYFTTFKEKGTTAQRPTYNQYVKGKQYFDTDINKPLWWNGSQWTDGAGNVIS